MIDMKVEALLTLTKVTRLLPRRRKGKKPHVATLYRWAKNGLRGIRLEVIQVGGTMCTSREALQRFFSALTKQVDNSLQTKNDDSRLEIVEAELDRLTVERTVPKKALTTLIWLNRQEQTVGNRRTVLGRKG